MLDFVRRHAFGGPGQGGNLPHPNPAPPAASSSGGKATIKYNPTSDEQAVGIRPQATLFVWQSPDGQPHFVTISVGRLSAAIGTPGNDITHSLVNPIVGGAGGGGATFPAGQDKAGNKLSYRAVAQVTLGTPGAMQDPFFIDINRGQSFSAMASYVAVTAQMLPPPATDAGTSLPNWLSGSLTVYGTIGIGTAPTVTPVLFTQYIDDMPGQASTGSWNRTIPPRANMLMPVRSGNTNADQISIEFLDAALQLLDFIPAYNNGAMVQPVMLGEDYFELNLQHTNLNATNFRLVYQISV